jgi:hypothetical protein
MCWCQNAGPPARPMAVGVVRKGALGGVAERADEGAGDRGEGESPVGGNSVTLKGPPPFRRLSAGSRVARTVSGAVKRGGGHVSGRCGRSGAHGVAVLRAVVPLFRRGRRRPPELEAARMTGFGEEWLPGTSHCVECPWRDQARERRTSCSVGLRKPGRSAKPHGGVRVPRLSAEGWVVRGSVLAPASDTVSRETSRPGRRPGGCGQHCGLFGPSAPFRKGLRPGRSESRNLAVDRLQYRPPPAGPVAMALQACRGILAGQCFT